MKKRIFFSVLITLLLTNIVYGADKYLVDPVHTSVGFSIKHLLISSVKGKFNKFSAVIIYDDKDITKSSLSAVIKANSIDTGIEDRDKHLRGPDFFDVEKYPEITFQSKNVEKSDEGYIMSGILTMHGVSREVIIPFTTFGPIKDPWGKTRIGFEAGLILNRRDFGISWNKIMDNGGLSIGNEVKIELSGEAVKEEL